MEPLRVGIIGMGGFAGTHHDAVYALEADGKCQLVCCCDPGMDTYGERRHKLGFAARNVRVFHDYLTMLDTCAGMLDVVTIPTPVPLHAPMHRACVERGLAVYLEKPPTLDWRELNDMLACEANATKLTNVGFNFIVDPLRQDLKRRVAEGEFGPVKRASIIALSPRADKYYARASWAGRLMLNGRLVLDSCLGNAMAHHVHNALFWCGDGALWEWGGIREVSAELYRAHRIEGMDTVFLRAATERGNELVLAMSHACAGGNLHEERVECERATIDYIMAWEGTNGTAARHEIRWNDGRTESRSVQGLDFLKDNLEAYFAYLQGRAARPMTGLIDARPFVHLNDLAYVAARKINTVPENSIKRTQDSARGTFVAIADLERICRAFLNHGAFPSAQQPTWGGAGGTATEAELPQLFNTVRTMTAPQD